MDLAGGSAFSGSDSLVNAIQERPEVNETANFSPEKGSASVFNLFVNFFKSIF
jgi:hypothetical protein